MVERAGLIFAHFGANPAPGLLMFDVLNVPQDITIQEETIPCNWLQIAENGVDPVHLEWLHGHFVNARANDRGDGEVLSVRAHSRIEFERTDLGLVKRRLLDGQATEGEDWTIGQQLIFPSILYHADSQFQGLQFRVPIDDESTYHVWWKGYSATETVPKTKTLPSEVRLPNGQYNLDSINGQDVAIWVSQGRILDRSTEHLGRSDRGISLYRQLLLEELGKVESGGSPLGATLRTPVELPKRRESESILSRN
ncbi:MAG: RHO alpha subunit C-terminal catalytic domain-containing protein [Acidimicrobiales bacterium]